MSRFRLHITLLVVVSIMFLQQTLPIIFNGLQVYLYQTRNERLRGNTLKLVLSQAEYNSLDFCGKPDEFQMNGKRFDIVSRLVQNGTIILLANEDTSEEKLLKFKQKMRRETASNVVSGAAFAWIYKEHIYEDQYIIPESNFQFPEWLCHFIKLKNKTVFIPPEIDFAFV